MISGASSYRPSAQGPPPSPPKSSQSLAPTGWTPRASAVSASPQPRATTRVGSLSTVTSPKAVLTVAGKAPEELLEPSPLVALPPSAEPELQLVTARATASRAAPRRARVLGMGWLLGQVGQAHLTMRGARDDRRVRPSDGRPGVRGQQRVEDDVPRDAVVQVPLPQQALGAQARALGDPAGTGVGRVRDQLEPPR